MILFNVITGVAITSSLFPFLVGLKVRNRISYLKLLVVLTGVSFICDVMAISFHLAKLNPNSIGNTYTVIEFVILLAIYYRTFNNPNLLRIFLAFGLLSVLFFVLNFLFLQQEKINSYTQTFTAFVFIGLSIAYFYRLMRQLPALQIYHLPMFWISVALLIYAAGNMFLFTLSHYLVNTLNDNLVVYWSFHNFLLVVKNVLFAIGLWQNLRAPKLL